MEKKTKAGLSDKEGSKDVPSWAKGKRPLTTENGRELPSGCSTKNTAVATIRRDRAANSARSRSGATGHSNDVQEGGVPWRRFTCCSMYIHRTTARRMSS